MTADKRTFFLAHAEARRRVGEFAASAPEGWRATFEPPKRNSDINAALHAMLGEISDAVEWAGKRWDIETWKRLLVAAWMRATQQHVLVLPSIDGMGVDVVFRRTSEMTQAEVRDLLGFIEAWKAEQPAFQHEEA